VGETDMAGRTVVVTGASSGIGQAAARRLHGLGARVVVVGRSPERTTAMAEEMGTPPVIADFARLAEVRTAAAQVLERCDRIDVLVNNAGLSVSRREHTDDGHEVTFQVNHLATFLFTSLLLDRLRASAPSRVVTTASFAHLWGLMWPANPENALVSGPVAYSSSKLDNILFTRELGRRLSGSGVLATCFNPGVVATGLGRQDATGLLYRTPLRRLMRSPEDGADTLVWLATAPADELEQGAYYSGRRKGLQNLQARAGWGASALWQRSEEMVAASS
jgi:NAD(P)-dependent dehydrogenase (short-subunit alcohol dehydrogenase family)